MKNKADITIVLDKSGSMSPLVDETISGLNAFLEEQKTSGLETTVTLNQFDHEFECTFGGVPVHNVAPITRETYRPRGYTALLDAVGRTIDELGSRLRNTPEYERPNRVVVVIMTDGHENSSRQYTRDRIFEMIRHQEDVYNWEFIFLGAGQDAIQAGANLGVKMGSSLAYGATSKGVGQAFDTVSRAVKNYCSLDDDAVHKVKCCSADLFSTEDRASQDVHQV